MCTSKCVLFLDRCFYFSQLWRDLLSDSANPADWQGQLSLLDLHNYCVAGIRNSDQLPGFEPRLSLAACPLQNKTKCPESMSASEK